MPEAARNGDETLCIIEYEEYDPETEETTYECIPETRNVSIGSGDVYINGQLAARKNTDNTTHDPACNIKSGSSTVSINGQPAARIGDSVCCSCVNSHCSEDGVITEGSDNVSIGG